MATRLAAGLHSGYHGAAAHKSDIFVDTVRKTIALMD
jgi:hypothetical protein